MLFVDQDEITGTVTYTVCNDYGSCLIRTTSSNIANFVERHSHGIDKNFRLLIGGDPGSKKLKKPIFHHIRKYSR
jgi:hypothetical protein